MDALDFQVGGVFSVEEDRAQVLVIGVEDLQTIKLVPPPLAIAVQNTLTVDLDIFPSPFPEHDRVLSQLAMPRASLTDE